MKQNRMKEKLRAGEAAYGVSVMIPSPQIVEDEAAIRNIDELLTVDDIDVFFIGPSDLSQSMGHPGNPRAPAVAQAIESSFRRMVAAQRTPGTPAYLKAARGS